MAETIRLTPEVLYEEAADVLGYVDDHVQTLQIMERASRQVAALALLPEGYYVERHGYKAGIEGYRLDRHAFTVFDPDGDAVRCAETMRYRERGGDNVINLGSTYDRADECEATCKAVALLLAAIDYEAHARKPEVTS